MASDTEERFDPILHSKLWTIVKNISRYPDGSYERVAVEELTSLISTHDQQMKEKLLEALPDVKVGTEKLPLNDVERGFNVAADDARTAIEQLYNVKEKKQ